MIDQKRLLTDLLKLRQDLNDVIHDLQQSEWEDAQMRPRVVDPRTRHPHAFVQSDNEFCGLCQCVDTAEWHLR